MKFYRLSSANGYENYMLTDECCSLELNNRFEKTEPMLTEWGLQRADRMHNRKECSSGLLQRTSRRTGFKRAGV